jgi:outer membrane protein TolC
MMSRLQIATCSAIAATVLLSGCRVGPHYHVPPATAQAPPATYKESPTQFQETDGWKVAEPQDAMLRGKWWEIYNDPELNALEDQLNVNNQNIKISFENFMAARAIVREFRSQLFPIVGTSPSYQRSASSANLRNATEEHADLAALGRLMGARPVGTHPQYHQRRAVQRAAQRRRP